MKQEDERIKKLCQEIDSIYQDTPEEDNGFGDELWNDLINYGEDAKPINKNEYLPIKDYRGFLFTTLFSFKKYLKDLRDNIDKSEELIRLLIPWLKKDFANKIVIDDKFIEIEESIENIKGSKQ